MRWVALVVAIGVTPAFALIIDPTWGSGSQSFTSAQQSDIQDAINLYQSTFLDNITVDIKFNNMSGGLGQSDTAFYTDTWSDLLPRLTSNAAGPDDAAALAQIAANPIAGSTKVDISQANLKALGYSFSGSDGTIGLNAGICFTDHNHPVNGEYDLFAVACHEIDEVLGTVSGVGSTDMTIADVYRYNGSGARTLSTSTGAKAYFSIDGSTLLDQYNQNGVGDYGDWIAHNPGQVQDWVGSTGQTINPDVEFRLLDVVGYTRYSAAPEPASLGLLGIGAFGLLRRRRTAKE